MLVPLKHSKAVGREATESLCPALPIHPAPPNHLGIPRLVLRLGKESAGSSPLSLALSFSQHIVQFRHKAGAQ